MEQQTEVKTTGLLFVTHGDHIGEKADTSSPNVTIINQPGNAKSQHGLYPIKPSSPFGLVSTGVFKFEVLFAIQIIGWAWF